MVYPTRSFPAPVKEWAETSGLVTHSVPAEGLKSMNIEEVMDVSSRAEATQHPKSVD